jgi:DNA-binding response OmpR family regulator
MSQTILLVDDDESLRQVITQYLTQEGYRVIAAGNGADALKLFYSERPGAVLLDLMMPGMDGWEVYQKLKANETLQSIPVIVVTAKAQSIDKMLGLYIAKVDDYIAKPFSPQELVESIEKVLAKKLNPTAEAPTP